MPKGNEYRRGANFERRVMRHLEKQGWFCFRSAGSHKPADVIAFRLGEVMLIQCQLSDYFPPAKIEQVKRLAIDNCFRGLLCWRDDKNRIQFRELG